MYAHVTDNTVTEGRLPKAARRLDTSAWVQPTGAHDAYNTGDRVIFETLTYESLIDGNVWSPSAYPAGWATIG